MPKNETALTIKEMQTEIDKNFADQSTLNTLMTITFNGLKPETAKRAAMEATMRGYTFKDFLEKNIYAIPYGDKYSLVSSIDYYRKVGMRSGVCGSSAPVFEMVGGDQRTGNIFSCTITIKKVLPNGTIGEFASTAYMAEYNTGRNLWISKPRTMLAKVAEMQALRKACPEELAQAYIEEEMPEPIKVTPAKAKKDEVNAKLDYLEALLKTVGKTETAFLGFLKKSKMTDLDEGEVDEWITKLEEGITEAKAAKENQVIDAEVEEPVYEEVPEMEKTTLEKVMASFPDAEVISTTPGKPLTPKEKLAANVNKLSNYKKQ